MFGYSFIMLPSGQIRRVVEVFPWPSLIKEKMSKQMMMITCSNVTSNNQEIATLSQVDIVIMELGKSVVLDFLKFWLKNHCTSFLFHV